MMNDNIRAWIEQMRTTTEEQAQQHLAVCRHDEVTGQRVIGYCCLGLGSKELADVNVQIVDEGMNETVYMNQMQDLAPVAFRVWLGVLDEEGYVMNDESDVSIDYPLRAVDYSDPGLTRLANLRQQGHGGSPTYTPPLVGALMSAASLNDAGFTFAQIADVVAYFGLRREVA